MARGQKIGLAADEQGAAVEEAAGLGGVMKILTTAMHDGGAEGEDDGGLAGALAVGKEALDVGGVVLGMGGAVVPGEAADARGLGIAFERASKRWRPHAKQHIATEVLLKHEVAGGWQADRSALAVEAGVKL